MPRRFQCSRMVVCVFSIEAETAREALAALPLTADDCVQDADVVMFQSGPTGLWMVEHDEMSGSEQIYDDADILEAKREVAAVDLVLMDE